MHRMLYRKRFASLCGLTAKGALCHMHRQVHKVHMPGLCTTHVHEEDAKKAVRGMQTNSMCVLCITEQSLHPLHYRLCILCTLCKKAVMQLYIARDTLSSLGQSGMDCHTHVTNVTIAVPREMSDRPEVVAMHLHGCAKRDGW